MSRCRPRTGARTLRSKPPLEPLGAAAQRLAPVGSVSSTARALDGELCGRVISTASSCSSKPGTSSSTTYSASSLEDVGRRGQGDEADVPDGAAHPALEPVEVAERRPSHERRACNLLPRRGRSEHRARRRTPHRRIRRGESDEPELREETLDHRVIGRDPGENELPRHGRRCRDTSRHLRCAIRVRLPRFSRAGRFLVGLLAELLAGLPAPPPELRLGPGVGEDACAVEVGGEVLVVASDPVTLTAGRRPVALGDGERERRGGDGRSASLVPGGRPGPPGGRGRGARHLCRHPDVSHRRRSRTSSAATLRSRSAVTRPSWSARCSAWPREAGSCPRAGPVPAIVLVQVGAGPGRGRRRCSPARPPRGSRGSAGPARRGADCDSTVPGISVVEPALLAARAWERRPCTTQPRAASPLASTSSRTPRGCGLRVERERRALVRARPRRLPGGSAEPGRPLLREPSLPPSRHRSLPTWSGRSRPRAPPLPSSAASRLGRALATWTAKGSHGLNETRSPASPHRAQLPLNEARCKSRGWARGDFR